MVTIFSRRQRSGLLRPAFSPLTLLALVLLLGGCHPAPPVIKDPKDPKFVVADTDKWQITRSDLDTEIGSYLKQHQVTAQQVGAKMPLLETAMLDNMVLKKLMLEKAATLQLKDVDKQEAAELDGLKARIPPGQDFEKQLAAAGITLADLKQRIHEKVLITKVLEAEAFKDTQPTDQEINDVYVKNKDSFNIPPKIRASRVLILVDDKTSPADKAAKKKAIDKAHDRVAKGEEFSKVAMEVSEDQYSKPRGGDIGFFQRGENADAGFDDVAFNSKVDVLSPVFQTPLGYQFLKVTEMQAGGIVPIAEARDYIAKKLHDQKMGEEEQAYTKKLLADAKVNYHITRAQLPTQPTAPAPPPDQAPPPTAMATNVPTSAQPPPPAPTK